MRLPRFRRAIATWNAVITVNVETSSIHAILLSNSTICYKTTMLYLTRKLGETIIINGNIEVTVVEVTASGAKLGFNFPKEATILRKEVHDKIMQENITASQLMTDIDALGSLKRFEPQSNKDDK